jgi:hypothetical protein
MAIGDHDSMGTFAHAGRALRAVPDHGWDAMEDRIIRAVRDTPRGGWPITVTDPTGRPELGTLAVSDLALRTALSRAIRPDPDSWLLDVAADVRDGELVSVTVSLSGRYGVDLRDVVARVERICAQVVADVVGPTTASIEATVTDVHR